MGTTNIRICTCGHLPTYVGQHIAAVADDSGHAIGPEAEAATPAKGHVEGLLAYGPERLGVEVSATGPRSPVFFNCIQSYNEYKQAIL